MGQPDCWYWTVVYLTRNVFVILTVALTASNGFAQIIATSCALVITGIPTAVMRPWRSLVNDVTDIMVNGSLLLFVLLSAPSVRTDEQHKRSSAEIAATMKFGL